MARVRGAAQGVPAARPARDLSRTLYEGGARAAGPHGRHHARAGGAAVAGGGAGIGPPALAHHGSAGAALAPGVLHVRRAVGLGEGERVPVGGRIVGWNVPLERLLCTSRCGRSPGGTAVGAGARLPVVRDDLCQRRKGQSPGGAEVGAGAGLPVGYSYVFLCH